MPMEWAKAENTVLIMPAITPPEEGRMWLPERISKTAAARAKMEPMMKIQLAIFFVAFLV